MNEKDKSLKNPQKEKKLSAEIAKIISIVFILVFLCIIAVVAIFTGSALSDSIAAEFTEMSGKSAEKVKSIIVSAKTAADNINSYLEKAYEMKNSGKKNMRGSLEDFSVSSDSKFTSMIYDTEISELSSDVEQYITEIIRQTAKANEDIIGLGIMFEPFAFDENIKDYAFYITGDNSEEKIKPYGAYSSYSAEVYYTDALSAAEPFFTDPYAYGENMIVTYCVPIIIHNQFSGVITADVNVTNFSKVHTESPRYPSKYTTILDHNGVIIYDSESEDNIGASLKDFITDSSSLAKIESNMKQSDTFDITIRRSDGSKEYCYYNPIVLGDIKWWALTALDSSEKNKTITQTLLLLFIITVAALGIIIASLFYLLNNMLKPISTVVEAAENIANGNLNLELSHRGNDEIGHLTTAFQATVEALRNIIDDISYLLRQMADGNFNVKTRAESHYIGDFQPLLASVREINTKLSNTLGQINDASSQVAAASDQMAKSAQILAEGSTEQAGAVEELLATVNEVSNQVEQNAAGAADASRQAGTVGSQANDSNEQMKKMTEAMSKINETSKQIVNIIESIENIASQTNLLSLNAAIEAARAGESGKGFAVVAGEIRDLASQSSEAASNTRTLIESTLAEIKNGSQIAENTASSLTKVVKGVEEIIQIADGVKESSERQASSIQQVSQGIEQISEVVQSNSATAEESSAASEELSAQADGLSSLVKSFELKRV